MKKGVLKIPIVNPSHNALRVCRADFRAFVDVSVDGDFVLLEGDTGRDKGTICGVAQTGPSDFSVISQVQFGEKLTPEEKESIRALLRRHINCFPSAGGEVGPTTVAEHTIEMGDAEPVWCRPYRVSAVERKEIAEEVSRLLEAGIVKPSYSPWTSPVMFARKDGKRRFVIDYRGLKKVTRKDVYPLPRIDDVLDRVPASRYFTSLDLTAGYHQVAVAEKDRCKTAFVTPDGLFEFNRLPFGVCGGPATFQRLMDRVLGSLKWTACLVYLDDILISSKAFSEHTTRLQRVLDALGKAGLTLSPGKCIFASHEICHLGHKICAEGIQPGTEKIRALRDFRVRNIRSLRGFLRYASFYRRFIPDFAAVASPLYALMKKMQPGIGAQPTKNHETK